MNLVFWMLSFKPTFSLSSFTFIKRLFSSLLSVVTFWSPLVAQVVKSLTAMQETQVWSLHWEDLLEKEMATYSSNLGQKIPWMEDPGRYSPWGCKESDMTEPLHFHFSVIKVVSSAYLRLLVFLPAILIPACASFIPAFHMMYSAYKLNKQGDNIQPWRTPFPIWNQSVVPCPVLNMPANLQNSAVATVLEKVSFHSKKGNAK